MSKFWIILLILSTTILVIAFIFFSKDNIRLQGLVSLNKVLKTTNSEKIEDTQFLPNQLTDNFDSTLNDVIFKPISINLNDQEIVMSMVFPTNQVNLQKNRRITCKNDDYQIVEDDKNKVQKVSKDFFLSEINKKINERLLIVGKCTDNECDEINSGCKLVF